MEKKYLGSAGLARLLERLFETFSKVGHTHTKSQITDFPEVPTQTSQLINDSEFVTAVELNERTRVDSELSSTSENPVQNKVISAELQQIRDANIGSELISVADIDTICGSNIQYATNEVTF